MLDGFEFGAILGTIVLGVAAIILTIRREGRRSRAKLHAAYAEKMKARYELGRIVGRNEGRLEAVQRQLWNIDLPSVQREQPPGGV